MQDLMRSLVNRFGYFGVFLLILIENIFPPIPSEAVLLSGGALTVTSSMSIPGTILAATAGSLLGAVVLYLFGKLFSPEQVKNLIAGRLGKKLHIRPEHVDRAVRWFARYQSKAVLIGRCVPVIRSLISIPAGFAKMDLLTFLLLTAIGSTAWNTLLVLLGAGLGNAWEYALPYFEKYTSFVASGIIVACVALAGTFILKKRQKK